MATIVDVKNPIELHTAGMRALTSVLGYDGAQAFMNQSFGGYGNWTQERHELPEQSFEDFRTELGQTDNAIRARQIHAQNQ